MRVSIEKLEADAEATGFRVDMLVKVVRMMGVLRGIRDHPYLKGRLVLNGGTALNLFVFDLPRLSVDIDLNYVGTGDREAMLSERPKVERALTAVFGREDLAVRRMPVEHAGGKWGLRYAHPGGRRGTLEVDVNYRYRVPLWPVSAMDSQRLGSWKVRSIPVVDIHELVAGKLCALFSRSRARDLYDSRLVLSPGVLGLPGECSDLTGHASQARATFDPSLLRIAFVVYGAMNRRDWRTVSVDDVGFSGRELSAQLVPALRDGPPVGVRAAEEYGSRLVRDCRKALSAVMPLEDHERVFLDLLLDKGEIEPSLLTPDEDLAERIRAQPLLQWKAAHVRRHKGLSWRGRTGHG